MPKQPPQRRMVIGIVIVMCIVLYFAGVLSGLYANKITEERTTSQLYTFQSATERDLAILREGTEVQIEHLHDYITFLETNLNTIQLEQAFLATLDDDVCSVANSSLHHITGQLQAFRARLPFRLELYEKHNEPTEEYALLKQQYNTLSLRTWLLLRNYYSECDIVNGLYLYTRTCKHCVLQGEELDTVTAQLSADGREIMLFTVDASAADPTLQLIKTYYNITDAPAIILNENVYRGFHWAQELLEGLT